MYQRAAFTSVKNSTQTKGSLPGIVVHSFQTYEEKSFLYVKQQRIIIWLCNLKYLYKKQTQDLEKFLSCSKPNTMPDQWTVQKLQCNLLCNDSGNNNNVIREFLRKFKARKGKQCHTSFKHIVHNFFCGPTLNVNAALLATEMYLLENEHVLVGLLVSKSTTVVSLK